MSGQLPDLSSFFERYEQQAREADALFERVRSQYPDLVICKEQCSSCCHALFDLSLVEALYLNQVFLRRFPTGLARDAVIQAADKADRAIARIKRKVFQESKAGRDSNEILREVSGLSVRCPLLGDDDLCLLYDSRPITCRLYGAPTAIGGKAHTCGKTGFVQGQSYPTVALDKVQQRLGNLSLELAAALGSAYTELAAMYVPVSTALITDYTAEYLGVGVKPGSRDEK
jgi:Fe-S-cluster containining protein